MAISVDVDACSAAGSLASLPAQITSCEVSLLSAMSISLTPEEEGVLLIGRERQDSLHAPSREKAQAILDAVQAEVLQALRTQRHLLGTSALERRTALANLAENLLFSEWHPEKMTHEEVEVIDPSLMRGLVYAINDGRGLQGYASKLYELYTILESPEVLPQMQDPEPRRLNTKRRSGPRRSMPQS